MLTSRFVRSVLGNDLIVHVNPQKIDYYIGSNNVKFQGLQNSFAKNLHRNLWFENEKLSRVSPFKIYSFYIKSRDYSIPLPVESHWKHHLIKDFLDNIQNFRQSFWYKKKRDDLLKFGKTKHKSFQIDSLYGLDQFFEKYVLALVHSMKTQGYICNEGDDLGNIMINEDGTFHKSNAGDHRFFVAKLVGVKLMPFKINGVHEQWKNSHSIPSGKKGLYRLTEEIKRAEKMNQ